MKQKLIMKYIRCEHGTILAELAKEFGVSRQTVYNALYYKTNTKLAQKIRQRAQQLGGVLMVSDGKWLTD